MWLSRGAQHYPRSTCKGEEKAKIRPQGVFPVMAQKKTEEKEMVFQ